MTRLFDRIHRRDLRLGSGLVLFTYLSVHLVNHALGLVSLDVAEAGLRLVVAFWHSLAGTVLLYGAAATHVALALLTVYERRTLRMPAAQALRTVLGLWMPVVLITHFAGTRLAFEQYGLASDYARIIPVLWNPTAEGRQLALLVPGWIHGCLGLKFAFGGRKGFQRLRLPLFGAALLLPVLAALGFLAMGRELAPAPVPPATAGAPADTNQLELWLLRDGLLALYLGVIALAILARTLRGFVERRTKALVTISYPGRKVQVPRTWSVLEASRSFGIPHLSLCGGNARCSTCRVRIEAGAEHCPSPSPVEQKLLSRMRAGPAVRLACQLRPRGDISVKPLFATESAAWSQVEKPPAWQERDAVILVADLRRSEGSPSAHRSAHDTAYALNLFYEAFGDAVSSAGGTLGGCAGPEALAIFGLKADPQAACRQTLDAMARIEESVRQLNARLASDIGALGRLVLAAHVGSVVSGLMGHADAKAPMAVGLAVDITRRLRDQALRTGAGCVVSKPVLEGAGQAAASMRWQDAGLDQHDRQLQVRAAASLTACLADDAVDAALPTTQ